MKAFLFCTSYIADRGQHVPGRYMKYISFYQSRLAALGAEHLFLVNDGRAHIDKIAGSMTAVISAETLPDQHLMPGTYMISFEKGLGRPSIDDHCGWWRSFVFSYTIARRYGFDKIIHVESDFFLLSERLLSFIRSISSGWHSLWSSSCKWPESGIQIICKDRFEELFVASEQARSLGYNSYYPAEHTLPFSAVHRHFLGDRLDCLPSGTTTAGQEVFLNYDYIGNVPVNDIVDGEQIKL
ncbi:hypothetical protein HGH92_30445 [Chitinophaga varians]|uniref:Uncharacterized protein n=1 Tax=Chitinophaga varians TaxID=2202339 RepID=A0A847RZV4_9BACT|nr:hypothetical protein [Chitinophaga varians]NLR68662.1 hypothetical protein [Chitinophaga varians]